MLWTVLVLLLVSSLLLLLLFSRRSRSNREPPLDKGAIPWLGHALEFGRDAASFVTGMKKKHGDIFTVRVAGRYVTVLLDPHSFDAVLQDRGSLDFSRYAQVLMDRIFKLRLPKYNPGEEKAIMRTHFQGDSLAALNATMLANLQALLASEVAPNRTDWKRDGLFSLCYSLLFRAGFLTLFGGEQNNNGSDAGLVYKEYRTFDRLLTKMARTTLNSGEKKTAGGVRERLWRLLSLKGLSGESSPWLRQYRRHLLREGADGDAQTRAMLLQLWATQGNVGPAAFWLLAFLLTHPEAMAAVRREFGRAAQGGNRLEQQQPTPVFDSALEETLRLTAAPFITREVLQDKTLRMATGHEYRLRRGDRVCLFPLVSPQMDPEIYQEPEKFKYNRFLNSDGTPKREFYKGGQRLKYYTMPWGAGANGCVGKPFAINAIRQLVFLVVSRLDVEPCDPASGVPAMDPGRYGFGMVQPVGDLPIRYKVKSEESL
ncbi:prostacyclin synthase-like [Denticeps clupeoides]|uniref:prostacyclin synthase-like n=1 Tax=Denticeps clupeoides TaxID=299321 RepID=UPI0010A2CF18|nr:prostacyclin synthase-like [Denticeps clupeoides]